MKYPGPPVKAHLWNPVFEMSDSIDVAGAYSESLRDLAVSLGTGPYLIDEIPVQLRGITSTNVDCTWNCLKVPRIDAGTIATQMIKFQPFRYWTSHLLVDHAMRVITFRVELYLSVPLGAPTVVPQPAGRFVSSTGNGVTETCLARRSRRTNMPEEISLRLAFDIAASIVVTSREFRPLAATALAQTCSIHWTLLLSCGGVPCPRQTTTARGLFCAILPNPYHLHDIMVLTLRISCAGRSRRVLIERATWFIAFFSAAPANGIDGSTGVSAGSVRSHERIDIRATDTGVPQGNWHQSTRPR